MATYDVDYFIKKFIDINGRCCAYGHCGVLKTEDFHLNSEANALNMLFRKSFFGRSMFANRVNDGDCFEYLQPTPKQRILAALNDIKKLQS